MTDAVQITDITIDREASLLRLSFDDGTSGSLELGAVRMACPCAGCRAARQKGRTVWNPTGQAAGPGVRSAELVGAWGLSITWGDGHSTGIYPFTSLAAWIRDGHPSLTPDSGLSG